MLRHLLVYRLIIVNLLGLVFLGVAYINGWVGSVVSGDHTGIVWVVVAFFVAFMLSLTNRALKVSANLDRLKAGGDSVWLRDFSGVKFLEKNAHLDDMPGWIMLIGLLGNVIGIMMSIRGANLGGGADAQASIQNLLGSMSVAFSATIASGVLGLWADINRRMLRTATVLMTNDVAAKQMQVAIEMQRRMA